MPKTCRLSEAATAVPSTLGLKRTNFTPEEAVEGGAPFRGVEAVLAWLDRLSAAAKGRSKGFATVKGAEPLVVFLSWLSQEKRELVVKPVDSVAAQHATVVVAVAAKAKEVGVAEGEGRIGPWPTTRGGWAAR